MISIFHTSLDQSHYLSKLYTIYYSELSDLLQSMHNSRRMTHLTSRFFQLTTFSSRHHHGLDPCFISAWVRRLLRC